MLKVPRLASPESSDLHAAEVETSTVGRDKVAIPSGEMDALDAAEAAQFKADVQGHRHQEVSRACVVKTSPSECMKQVVLRRCASPVHDVFSHHGTINQQGCAFQGVLFYIAFICGSSTRCVAYGILGWTCARSVSRSDRVPTLKDWCNECIILAETN